MKICDSTEILDHCYDIETAMDMLAEAGFEAFDLAQFSLSSERYAIAGEDYKAAAVKLREKSEKMGTPFVQSHAPFPSQSSGEIYGKIVRSIEVAGLVGAGKIVVHPICDGEDLKKINMAFYRSLLPYAKKAGVVILLENMYGRQVEKPWFIPSACGTGEDFAAYIDELDSPYFGACLDIGHIRIVGEDEVKTIHTLGSRIKALHVHDTDGVFDLHTAVFTQSLDFLAITKALRDVGYKGDFTLESNEFLHRMPVEMYPSALKFMAQTAKFLADKI